MEGTLGLSCPGTLVALAVPLDTRLETSVPGIVWFRGGRSCPLTRDGAMDPNATLKQLRELVKTIHDQRDIHLADLTEEAEDMANLVEALDEWMTGGGFKPRDWEGC